MTDRNLENTIYMDNAATSYPKPEAVYVAMDVFARDVGGSGGRSSHRRAFETATVVDGARESLATLFGAHGPECVCFGANATDALNIAIYGLAEPGRRIITSLTEHNSVRRPIADLRDRYGCELIVAPADGRGIWNPRDIIGALTRDTALVAVGWASNVTGALQDIEPVARACRRLDVPLIVDAAQICGAYPFDFKSLGLAALAFTGHKSLLGPQGTGGLVVDPEIAPRIRPLRRGGSGTVSHSEIHPEFLPDRFEAGTMNCHGLAGLQAGARYLIERGVESIRAHEMKLWRRLRDGFRDIDHVRVHGPDEAERSMSIVSVTVQGMEPNDVGFLLDMRYGILTRTGLHCAPGSHQAIGTMPTGTVRFSLGFASTEAEVDAVLFALAHIREREQRGSAAAGAAARPAEADRAASPAWEKSYTIDHLGFLVDSRDWDEDFARSLAHSLGIAGELTEKHWEVIRFIRSAATGAGRCPLVYETCKQTGIGLEGLQRLFPTGYLRGACKAAGITYQSGSVGEPRASEGEAQKTTLHGKTYVVNAQGFLLNPIHWDEVFAFSKVEESGQAGSMTDRHWMVIRRLRESFERTKKVPTVFEACKLCGITLEEMEQLFPAGYQRGAVKAAGLRVL